MTACLQPTIFDYKLVPIEDRKFLQDTTASIRFIARATGINIIAIGNHLKNVYDRLPSHFAQWVESETSLTLGNSWKMIRAAEAFGVLSKQQLELFDATALYVLSQYNVRKDVRQMAIEMASGGEKITGRKAKDIVNCFKTKTTVDKKDVTEYFNARKAVSQTFPDERPKTATAQNEINEAAWDAFKHLVNTSARVYCERMDDTEGADDGDSNPWQITIWPKTGRAPKMFTSADSMEALVLEAADRQPMRECASCKKNLKLYDGYSRKDGNSGGRASACRNCEVARVTEAKRKAKAKRFQGLVKPNVEGRANPNPSLVARDDGHIAPDQWRTA